MFLLTCVSLLPLKVRQILGFILGYLFSLIPTRDRRIATLQLKLFLPDALATLPRIYTSLGQTVMETSNLDPLLANDTRYIECADWDTIESLRQSGRGILALSAHTGNWDLLAAYMVKRGLALSTIGRPARNPFFQQVLEMLRTRYGIRTLWRSGTFGLRELISELRAGRIIAALIDQDTRVAGACIPFFGHLVQCPSTLVDLAKRSDALIVTAFIVRVSFSKFRVEVTPLDQSQASEQILVEYNRRLETLIRNYPSQWVWFHKRWRTFPDGRRLGGREYEQYLTDQCRNLDGSRELRSGAPV